MIAERSVFPKVIQESFVFDRLPHLIRDIRIGAIAKQVVSDLKRVDDLKKMSQPVVCAGRDQNCSDTYPQDGPSKYPSTSEWTVDVEMVAEHLFSYPHYAQVLSQLS